MQTVDVNFESWPGNHKPLEPEGTGTYREADQYSNSSAIARDVGTIGCRPHRIERRPIGGVTSGARVALGLTEGLVSISCGADSGQSGWFISAVALQNSLPLTFTALDTNGNLLETKPLGIEAFSTLTLANVRSAARACPVKPVPALPSRSAPSGTPAQHGVQ